jgi:hypothetical protein
MIGIIDIGRLAVDDNIAISMLFVPLCLRIIKLHGVREIAYHFDGGLFVHDLFVLVKE